MRRDILRAPERHEGRQGPSETGLLLCLGAGVEVVAGRDEDVGARRGEGLGDGASLGSAFEGRPSMTPPVSTVVSPPWYLYACGWRVLSTTTRRGAGRYG